MRRATGVRARCREIVRGAVPTVVRRVVRGGKSHIHTPRPDIEIRQGKETFLSQLEVVVVDGIKGNVVLIAAWTREPLVQPRLFVRQKQARIWPRVGSVHRRQRPSKIKHPHSASNATTHLHEHARHIKIKCQIERVATAGIERLQSIAVRRQPVEASATSSRHVTKRTVQNNKAVADLVRLASNGTKNGANSFEKNPSAEQTTTPNNVVTTRVRKRPKRPYAG
jgi:hypothetical protein